METGAFRRCLLFLLLLSVVTVVYISVNNTPVTNTTLGSMANSLISHNNSVVRNLEDFYQNLSLPEKDYSTKDFYQTKEPESSSNISRDLGLYLRMSAAQKESYFNNLVLSMKYFWLLPVDLTVVLDDTAENKMFAAEVEGQFPHPKICFTNNVDAMYHYNIALGKEQLPYFYPENCVHKKYVGFIDSNTFFITPVTPELLFNGNKPHMNCVYGLSQNKGWRIGTHFILQKKEIFECTSYFPVIIKMEHIIEMRQHIENLHQRGFSNTFAHVSWIPSHLWQYNIMGNYLWYFHRDEYQFHAQYNKPGYTWSESPSVPPMNYYQVNVTEGMKVPQPAAAVHQGNFGDQAVVRATAQLVKTGICKSGGSQLCPVVCAGVAAFHDDLFKFEDQDWTWDERCTEAQEQHYMNVNENYSKLIQPQILEGCQYLMELTKGKGNSAIKDFAPAAPHRAPTESLKIEANLAQRKNISTSPVSFTKTNTHSDRIKPKAPPATPTVTSTPGRSEETFNISRDFGLYLRMTAGKGHDYLTMLVPSMKYFWFLPVDLTIVLDDTPGDRKFGAEIAAKYPYPTICYEKKIEPSYYHGNGKSFSQLSNLLADNCFNKSYVGFIDTDTFFITSVTPELMFSGTKPIVIGGYGSPNHPWPKGTEFALKRKEVLKCMTYFPVTIKLEHIIEMRKYIEKIHNKTFLDFFAEMSMDWESYSQFAILCNYMWYFHRDEYKFYAQFRAPGFVWTDESNPPGRQSLQYYKEHVLNDEITYPFPRSSIHFRYHRYFGDTRMSPDIIRVGVCYSGGHILCPDICRSIKRHYLHTDLYKFEDTIWT